MKQRGVTLIQMMCALALAGLLANVGLPAYNQLSDDLHRASAARDLAQALRSARSHALLQQQTVLVEPLEGDWGKGWRTRLAHNNQSLREQRLARKLSIASNLGKEVKFSGLGVPLRGNGGFLGGTLEICRRTAQASRYWIVLAPSGRVDLRTVSNEPSRCAGA
ncbi:GspH/FimT family protein [Pseudomonas sp. p1(2021b)]|uniref:GspH/FimT family pseudopilin n=1 Tax=Pseudomonas sp. p1(2021b) TaxID=2874628 RepID=UPI001CCBE0C8|nr:GspH/FimT family protein [Pseudomonas sp. p1(2021b)]UBM26053.1 GspH/FimT family protein [Pseudomonas sp. p1(2021b)]